MSVIKTYLLEDTNIRGLRNKRKTIQGRTKGSVYSSLVNPTTRFVNHISYIAVGVSGDGLQSTVHKCWSNCCNAQLCNTVCKPINEITGDNQMQNAIASLSVCSR